MWWSGVLGACAGWGDWGARNRNHRNRLGRGALYSFSKPTSTGVGGAISSNPKTENRTDWLIMRGGTYDGACTGWGDWKERNHYHRNSLEAGALYTFPKQTSARVAGGLRPMIFGFAIRIISFSVLAGGGYKDLFTTHEYTARHI